MFSPGVRLKLVVFGTAVVSILASKCLVLRLHYDTVSTAAFLLYLPTVFIYDTVVICLLRAALPRQPTRWSIYSYIAASLFSLFTLMGTSSQIGFYIETGGSINWRDAAAFTTDHDGLMVLLSGLTMVLSAGMVLLALGMVLGGSLYALVGAFLESLRKDIKLALPLLTPLNQYKPLTDHDLESGSDSSSISSEENFDEKGEIIEPRRKTYLEIILPLLTLSLLLFRPEKPYRKITTTLPVTMLGMFEPLPDACSARNVFLNNPFPFPDLISTSGWKKAQGEFDKGWAPSASGRLSPLAEMYRERQVDWISDHPPRGFFRWDPSRFTKGFYGWLSKNTTVDQCAGLTEEDVYYNPVSDPLKISNLDMEILPEIKEAMGKINIKHVVLVMMEGVRKDVWPLQKGSGLYDKITKRFKEEDLAKVDEKLAKIMPNIQQITGLNSGFPSFESKWENSAKEGYGGINVQGAYTAATMTSKAYQSLHCGTPPMSVDGFEEADLDDYQPCLPQIFDALNQVSHKPDSKDYRDRPWKTALFQSTSEQYDRLDVMGTRMGFHHRLTRKEIEEDKKRFNSSNSLYKKVNYFAYPEPVIVPYLEEYLDETIEKNERMFLTHVTSTTHHRWDVPSDFAWTDYDGKGMSSNLNKFLNTMRYHDEWMGTLSQLLQDKGMAEETLIVYVADHGLSFVEDSGKEGTYENDHISNFRIGLTFRHPQLPSVQHSANTTSIAVLPTILDLLISSGSLNPEEKKLASDLVFDYEGQSLIRPYKTRDGDRRAWAVTVVNPGARRLVITSGDAPWRLGVPLTDDGEYRVTNVVEDPLEKSPITSWTPEELLQQVKEKMGDDAGQWTSEAIPIARWWALEKQRLWRYKA